MTPHVTIKQRVNAAGVAGSEVFIYYGGRTFYSRMYLVADTPHTRAMLAQEFLRRLKRFPSEVLAHLDYEATQARVEKAMSERGELIQFAKAGAPPAPKRPTLSVVRNE